MDGHGEGRHRAQATSTSSSIPGAKYTAHLPATLSCTHRDINDDSRFQMQPIRGLRILLNRALQVAPSGRSCASHDLSRHSDTLSGNSRESLQEGQEHTMPGPDPAPKPTDVNRLMYVLDSPPFGIKQSKLKGWGEGIEFKNRRCVSACRKHQPTIPPRTVAKHNP